MLTTLRIYFGLAAALLPLSAAVAEPKGADSAVGLPGSPSVNELIHMGNAMADLGRYEEAITAFTLALEKDPLNGVALANRALSYAWTNHIAEATKDLSQAERLDPNDAVLHRIRALLANRRSDQETELKELTKSLIMEPGNPFALRFRASIYEERGQFDAALADAEAYIQARPEEPDAYELRATILADERKWPLALQQAHLIASRFAQDPRGLASAAQILERGGRRTEALDLMNHAIALDEGFYYLWKVRAEIRKWDDYAGRRLDLDQALELAPGDLNIIAQLGLLEFDQGNWRAAEERFSVVLAKDAPDFGVLAYRAMTKLKQGDLTGAKKDYDAAVNAATGPGDLSRICSAFVTEGIALDWAAETCDKAIAAQPTTASYRARRGLLEIRLGKTDRAIADFDAAIAHDPNLARAYYGRGVAYRRKGDQANAISDRDQARAIEPTVHEYFVAHGIQDLEHAIAQ